MSGELCECGRRRYTGADLKRWQDELNDFGAADGDVRYFNPDWAKAICWLKPGIERCGMKPLRKDDTK